MAVEEPLEIRVDGEALSVTMRTPGHDEELALGFLYRRGADPAGRARAGLTDDLAANVDRGRRAAAARSRRAALLHDAPRAGSAARARWRRSPCTHRGSEAGPSGRPRRCSPALPDRLRQPTFARTGGLHATGLFDADGELLIVREDVGRHNAMDKVVGRALLDGRLPLRDHILCVSGRLSFELVQKAAVAGAPILVGVGAPTSLAVELAADRGITLAGFAREGAANVYTVADRVI